MSDYSAPPRWTVKGDVLTFSDGEQIKFPSWVDYELIDRLGQLAHDYRLLGIAAANEVDSARMAHRDADALRYRAERAEATLNDLRSHDSNENVLAILTGDLETAINMIFRFAGMLGIQAGGELYDAIQALASKYKMSYTPPKDYSYEGTVRPTIEMSGGLARYELPPAERPELSFNNTGHGSDGEGQ